MRIIPFLGLVTMVAIVPAAGFAQGMPVFAAPESKQTPQEMSDRIVTAGGAPGIVIKYGVRNSKPATVSVGRVSDVPKARKVDENSLWRVYSMTKPVTGMAAMMLIEDGKISLDQPISDFIPAFKDVRVLVDPSKDLTSRPANGPITVRHLLTHTAGFTYGAEGSNAPLDVEYRRLGIVPAQSSPEQEAKLRLVRPTSLEEFANKVATLPLLSDPGAKFEYAISQDVLGRVIEVASGTSFENFVTTRLFKPLKMKDSFWTVPSSKAKYLTDSYETKAKKRNLIDRGKSSVWLDKPSFPYGGAGLVMSAHDYDRFLAMLLNGGTLDGVQVMKPETVKLGMSDLLPKGAQSFMLGITGVKQGFGAAGAVTLTDRPGGPAAGTYNWAGAAGSIAWVDPVKGVRGTVMINVLGESPLVGMFTGSESVRSVYTALGM